MKIWLKLFIGIIVGVLLGIFIPEAWTNLELIEKLSYLSVSLGRYILFPLVFFSVITGIYTLSRNKKTTVLFGKTIFYMVATSALLSIIGTLSVLLLSPERIPVFIEENAPVNLPGFYETLLTIFPRNFFAAVFQDGNHILPLFIMAILVGFNLNFDKVITRAAVQFFESMSGIFYHINSFIIELMGFFVIPMAWFLTEQIRNTAEIDLFRQMLLAIAADILLIIFIIYPIIIYFILGKKNPYKWIYGAIAPALAAAVSGDSLFCLGLQIKNSRENMGSKPEAGSVNLPLLAIFGRGGTAMITAVAFIVILKSYSSLGLNLSGVIWVAAFSFLASFIVGPFPGSGFFVSVSLLCSIYGKGIEEGYLILKPILPILFSVSVLLDTMTNSLVSMIGSKRAGLQEDIPIRKFS
ncbi:MAG: dicarboxylate/amino acid:cation symporter [Spirochaetales bacterium]|nr:dicarboxylate/amino acid:cation symporter [Spirochaetales bacterium]